MISVTNAKTSILENTPLGEAASSPLPESIGCVVAHDIVAPVDLPLFTNAAMDGFAVHSSDLDGASQEKPISLPIQMVVKAGDRPQSLASGMTAKIMTGAMIPTNADAVVMKELVMECGSSAEFRDVIPPGKNVRQKGEEIRAGSVAISRGTRVTPALIGFLSSLGLHNVHIYRKPVVKLLATGNELVELGDHHPPGKIFESNIPCLASALNNIPCATTPLSICADDPGLLEQRLARVIGNCDFIILTGGVSVGDYDYTKPVLERLGVKTIFWKVAQRPGKPFYFGKKRRTAIFGLPGNPASALVCYYEYILPAIRKFLGYTKLELEQSTAELIRPYVKKSGFSHFVRASAHYEDNQLKVAPLENQGSHIMRAFAEANCLMIAPPEATEMTAGTTVAVHWLPQT